MPKYSLILNIDEINEEITLEGDFPEEQWKTLELFLKYSEELISTKLVQEGNFGNSNIQWNEESGMNVSVELPDWDNVIVFLHRFRPLLLQNERTYFYTVRNILAKELTHQYIRSMLTEQLEIFSGKKNQQIVQIKSNKVLLNSEKVLYDWLNSHEFHREESKQEYIDSLHQMLPLDFSKVVFLGLLKDKVIAVFNLCVFIRVLIGKQNDANLRFRA